MRRCRLRLTVLLILTASLFMSCGIPNYFYTTSSYYGFSRINGYSDDYSRFRLYMTSNSGTDGDLNLIEDGKGPGLMLLYYIGDSGDTKKTLLSAERSLLNSKFQDKYQGTNKLGITTGRINGSETLLSYDYSNATFNFQAFRFADCATQLTPEFIAFLNARDSSDNLNYYFKTELDVDKINLRISTVPTFDDVNDILVSLVRFNGDRFIQNKNDISNADTDYMNFSKSTSSYFVHIFATITPQIGNFSNAFWTDLMEVGYVEVPVL